VRTFIHPSCSRMYDMCQIHPSIGPIISLLWHLIGR
jgi:hypothetical protein